MIYMEDAVRATIELMEAEAEKISIRTAYNLAAISFSAKELAENVAKCITGFKASFSPDERQKIADSWPNTINDSQAKNDWGWKAEYDLNKISQVMIENIKKISENR